jgi:hypothetical protein
MIDSESCSLSIHFSFETRTKVSWVTINFLRKITIFLLLIKKYAKSSKSTLKLEQSYITIWLWRTSSNKFKRISLWLGWLSKFYQNSLEKDKTLRKSRSQLKLLWNNWGKYRLQMIQLSVSLDTWHLSSRLTWVS